jgi:hypothetical protein
MKYLLTNLILGICFDLGLNVLPVIVLRTDKEITVFFE